MDFLKKLLFISLLFILSFIKDTSAQQKLWNIQACVEEAIQNNISVKNAQLNTSNAEINTKQAQFSRLPNLNANMGHNFQFGRSIDPSTNQFLQQRIQSSNIGLSSSVNLFNGFQQQNTVKLNQENLSSNQHEIEKVKNDVMLSVISNYLQVALNQQILFNSRIQASNTELQVARTSQLVNAGSLPEINLFQIKSQLATDKLNITRAENQVTLSKLALMQAMNIPVNNNFEIEQTEIPEPILEPAMAISSEETYQTAVNNQPQIKSAQARVNSSMLGIKVAQGGLYPRLSMFANISTFYSSANKQNLISGSRVQTTGFLANDPSLLVNSVVPNFTFNNYPFFSQLRDKIGEQVGFSMAIPIFNGRQTMSSIERSKVNAAIAKNNEQQIKNQLRQTIEQANADLLAASKNYNATKEALGFSEATFVNAEKRYNSGLMNVTEYLIQKNNLIVSQSNVLQAKYDCFFKLKLLEFYQGKAIVF